MFFPETKHIILNHGGLPKCLDGTKPDVRADTCTSRAGIVWSLDENGRLRNNQFDDKCLTANPKDKWNLVMEDCSDKDSQRFVFPAGFPTSASIVKPSSNDDLCWNTVADDISENNLVLGDCNLRQGQDFYYVPESERIINPSGMCLDDNFSKRK